MTTDNEPERLALLRFPARADRLKLVRGLVTAAVRMCECDEALERDVVLAVDEACQNVVRHAYPAGVEGDAELEILRDGIVLVFRLRDFGPKVDASCLRPGKLKPNALNGRGLHFIHDIMDEVGCLTPSDGTGNLLEMRKRLNPCGTPRNET
ncbi:MAG: ATP-binding protein [Chromatiales bacterium]|jgi:sigma-B regulation protein RsbU (phosphoserine phosphatase)|nr:ATP-binding protein [Chromatiales bacterium]MDX9766801.1 ATP-binding protein [Ectothiorhodospiraceae bacterium]